LRSLKRDGAGRGSVLRVVYHAPSPLLPRSHPSGDPLRSFSRRWKLAPIELATAEERRLQLGHVGSPLISGRNDSLVGDVSKWDFRLRCTRRRVLTEGACLAFPHDDPKVSRGSQKTRSAPEGSPCRRLTASRIAGRSCCARMHSRNRADQFAQPKAARLIASAIVTWLQQGPLSWFLHSPEDAEVRHRRLRPAPVDTQGPAPQYHGL